MQDLLHYYHFAEMIFLKWDFIVFHDQYHLKRKYN